MEEEKKSTKKDIISANTATRKLINGFISYSFLISFIFLIIYLVIINCLNKFTNNNTNEIINYTIPAICAIIIFFLIRGICYLSSFDLFKNSKINKKDVNIVSSNTNLFYILIILLTVFIIIANLTVRFKNQKTDLVKLQDEYYEIYSKDIANDLVIQKFEDYIINKNITTIQVFIVESGIILGIFSLFTYQKKLIEKMN